MSVLNWKRAAKVSLVMCLLSLPVWALQGRGDQRGGRGGGGGCGYNRNCGGGGGNNVPEGGSLLAYTGLTGAVLAGGIVLARKSRSL